MSALRNPNFADAMTSGDVQPGVPFAVIAEEQVALTGVFKGAMRYADHGDGWEPITAVDNSGKSINVFPRDHGIVPWPNGEWSDTYVVMGQWQTKTQ